MRLIKQLIILTSIIISNYSYGDVVARGSKVVGVQRISTIKTKSLDDQNNIRSDDNVDEKFKEEEVFDQSVKTEEENKEPVIIEDKSEDFASVLNKENSSDSDSSKKDLADKIKAQRALLDMPDTKNVSYGTGATLCDTNLRKCMIQKCGNDFLKCSGDTDTIWGDKMESCKLDSNCSGEEYTKLSNEIKADRDQNLILLSYNETLSCGAKYNSCITDGCGLKFEKCISRKKSEKVIADCENLSKECKAIDSGLASRFEEAFGTIRNKERDNIILQEKHLYELRDNMESTCKAIGAMFDKRTLDCVFTASFYANNSETPMSSKKLYAGSSFSCTPEYFGIDVTTFKENAYRETRAAKGATSAFLGAGLGVAAGAVTSGAISRATDKFNAQKQLAKLTGKSDEEIKTNNENMSSQEFLVKQELGKDKKVKEIKNEQGMVVGITAGKDRVVVVDEETGDIQSLIRYKDKKYNVIEEHNLSMFEEAKIKDISKNDKVTWKKTQAGNVTEIRVNGKVVAMDREIEKIEEHNLKLLSKVPVEDLSSGKDIYKTTKKGKIIEVMIDGKTVAVSDDASDREKTEAELLYNPPKKINRVNSFKIESFLDIHTLDKNKKTDLELRQIVNEDLDKNLRDRGKI